MSTATSEDMRVWVGCLGCYNAGALVGDWVDAISATEYEPHDALAACGIHPQHPAKLPPCGREEADETWCLDIEGPFLDGEMSPSEAQRIAEAVDALPEWVDLDAVAAYLDNLGEKVTDLNVEDFEEAYCGQYRNGGEYAEELADSIGAVDANAGWPSSHIDWQAAWEELAMDGYWISDAGYVFRA